MGLPCFWYSQEENRRIKLVIDFRMLDKMVEQCECPLPIIKDTLQQLVGFTYVTGINFNMGYLSLPLCKE